MTTAPTAPAHPVTTDEPDVDRSYHAMSPSEASTLDCHRKWHLTYVEGLRARKKGVALRTGICFDQFTNEWYANQDKIADVDERLAVAATAAGVAFEAEAELYRETADIDPRHDAEEHSAAVEAKIDHERQTLLAMCIHYVRTWGDEDIEVEGVQVPLDSVKLRTETGNLSRYSTKRGMAIDVLYRDHDGRLVMRDVKTTGRIDDGYRNQWSKSRQMLWYGVIMRELGQAPDIIEIDAAARRMPVWPEMSSRPVPVLDPATGEPLEVPVVDEAGDPVVFKSGPRKGEPKLEKVTRPALKTILSIDADGVPTLRVATTFDVLKAAIDWYGLDPADYIDELAYLARDTSRWFWRRQYVASPAALDRAQAGWLRLSKHRRDLTDEPMPSLTKCSMCPFAGNGVCEAASLDAVADVVAREFDSRDAPDEIPVEPDDFPF